jgi:hypothetical protein
VATLSVALHRPRRRLRQRDTEPYVFIFPNLILFSVFVLGPVVFSFGMSFINWDGLGPATFTGLRNYAKLLTDDLFGTAARNTLVYSFGTVLPMMAIALGLVLMLNAGIRGRTFFRGWCICQSSARGWPGHWSGGSCSCTRTASSTPFWATSASLERLSAAAAGAEPPADVHIADRHHQLYWRVSGRMESRDGRLRRLTAAMATT